MNDVNILKNNGVNLEASLEYLGDMETYDETLKEFLDLVDGKLAELSKYKEAHDMENYAILVHSLKSDSKYLGFMDLAEIALLMMVQKIILKVLLKVLKIKELNILKKIIWLK